MKKFILATMVLILGVAFYPSFLQNSSTFRVLNRKALAPHVYAGTGFMVDYKGYTFGITAAHVCRRTDELEADNGRKLKIIVIDPMDDLCIFDVGSPKFPKYRISGQELKLGQKVTQIGYPLGKSYTTETGRILELTGISFIEVEPYFYSDRFICNPNAIYVPKKDKCITPHMHFIARINTVEGNSGGPVVNSAGNIVGIVSASGKTKAGAILGVFTPVSSLVPLLDAVVSYKEKLKKK